MAAPLAAVAPPAAAGVLALTGALFEASAWQATPGKRWLGLRVMEASGRRVGWRRAAARHLLRAAPLLWWTLAPGWAPAAAALLLAAPGLGGRWRRTAWDRLAGTSVFAPPVGGREGKPHGAEA